MENSDQEIVRSLSDDDKQGLDLLYDFLSSLIVQFSQYDISSKDLVSISKGLRIVEGYETIVFNGSLEISTGERYKEGGSDYIGLMISSEGITLSHYGSMYTEGVGSDSFENIFLTIYGDHEYYGDVTTQFETWRETFFSYFPDCILFTEDMITFD